MRTKNNRSKFNWSSKKKCLWLYLSLGSGVKSDLSMNPNHRHLWVSVACVCELCMWVCAASSIHQWPTECTWVNIMSHCAQNNQTAICFSCHKYLMSFVNWKHISSYWAGQLCPCYAVKYTIQIRLHRCRLLLIYVSVFMSVYFHTAISSLIPM